MSIQHNKNRPNRPYTVRWIEAGKHHSRSFATKASAQAFDNQRKHEVNSGLYISVGEQKTLFRQYAEKYMRIGNRQQSTQTRDTGILGKHVFPVLGNRRINSVKRSDIQAIVDQWVAAGLKRRTIDRHLAVLSAIFRLAEADGIISKNPVVKISRPSAEAPHRRALNSEEIERLMEEVSDEYRVVIAVLIETGMRWGELAQLNIENFDALRNRLVIIKSKTRAGVRSILISSSIVALINGHLKSSARTGANGAEPLFISHSMDKSSGLRNGSRLVYSNFRSRVFKPAAMRAGLSDLQIHDLRRTSATHLVSQRISPKLIQERLGHADIRTTMNIYAQGTDKDHQSALESLATSLKGPVDSTEQHRKA